MNDRNAFGGKNPKSVYVPMSETEQEAISRLVEAQLLEVAIHGWGLIAEPKIQFGDKQIMIPISVTFDRIPNPVPVYFFDLELRTKTGICLFREKQSAVYDNKPVILQTGTELNMIWHIGIKAMDPALVKSIVPGAIGLTSRVIDKETGAATALGNYKGLSRDQVGTLGAIQRGEDRIKREKKKPGNS